MNDKEKQDVVEQRIERALNAPCVAIGDAYRTIEETEDTVVVKNLRTKLTGKGERFAEAALKADGLSDSEVQDILP